MVRPSMALLVALALGALTQTGLAADEQPALAELSAEFEQYSGAKLVFTVADLPPGRYHDSMPELAAQRQIAAAWIACREMRKLPPGYLGAVGLKAVAVFARCVSNTGDGFREYDEALKGYRYYGIYNGADAVAAAYYTDEQLPLTFHHEVFHHVDRVAHGPAGRMSDDQRLASALDGQKSYRAPSIAADDLKSLRQRGEGYLLESTVGEYASKNVAEDKAETARHLMSALADSLAQVVERPELPGSQRLLHAISLYAQALGQDGPRIDWFVDVALGRGESHPLALHHGGVSTARLIDALESFAYRQGADRHAADRRGAEVALSPEAARRLLAKARRQAKRRMSDETAAALAQAAAAATRRLLADRVCPTGDERQFVVLGQEDADGVNWTLRRDLDEFGQDAERLKEIASRQPELLYGAQLKNLRLIARWHVYIASRWQVTAGTVQLFEQARARIAASLPEGNAALAATLASTDFRELAERIGVDGAWRSPGRRSRKPANAYLKNVDDEIRDAGVRAAIRRAQPACVRLGGGSGVNLAASGRVLTAAHVVDRLGAQLTAEFPDGRRWTAKCIAIDEGLDLALCRLTDARDLAFAPLAAAPPTEGTRVVCIGQPSTRTPEGEPTDYQPFNVSTGTIRGFLDDRLGEQRLGRTKHDAWTYWGHSGSPLFNEGGEIVALHNSWDSTTAMRHAVTYEAIRQFLDQHQVELRAD